MLFHVDERGPSLVNLSLFSQDAEAELRGPRSQAGAWERENANMRELSEGLAQLHGATVICLFGRSARRILPMSIRTDWKSDPEHRT